ncbi:CubicO group peptidase (beta-lactamase class C family) [Nocardia transvalensis]|uniref:CubicO group peptidase (Beta-lactamase class C family) n=1 Tax=Nocardia transvalensis TaxID=37333 RepID=A0A7W9UHR2_9NOCA|nr:serine hydrolase [Nocardia transvalensis]MBB5913456.1 CubicO group peptidase (beta-lactamase class C family) [Nocardia transvalensis]
MGRILGWMVGVTVLALVAGGISAGRAQASAGDDARCAVSSGRAFERADPEQVGLDAGRLEAALAFAADRNRLNVKVFRHNCLIGSGPRNDRTGGVPWNIWSVTKSIVSLVAGIAWDQGKLDLSAPIGRYLPPGQGDAAHRAITVENLLTETSGLHIGTVNEGLTGVVPIDPNSAVLALGVHLDHQPGTEFTYSQRNVDLLSYIIELAVGEPLQQFAQRELFDPLGIARGDYYWARDRAGHTYGYAHLMIPPDDLAKLGLLVSNDGQWNGTDVVSADYLHRALSPSATEPCYGYLFWLGAGCVEMPSFLPRDTYEMAGLGLQNVFVIPSLGLTVVWTGAFGNRSSGGPSGVLQNTTELTHEFFRRLFAAFHEPPAPDPGPYVEPPVELDPRNYFDPNITLAVFGVGPDSYPGCTVVSCSSTPLAPPFADLPPGCLLVTCLGPDPRTPGIH